MEKRWQEPLRGRLKWKVAVITGGGEGIGFASRDSSVKEGPSSSYRPPPKRALDRAVKLIKRVHGVQGDVANLADLDRLVCPQSGGGSMCFNQRWSGQVLAKITEAHFDKLSMGNAVYGQKVFFDLE